MRAVLAALVIAGFVPAAHAQFGDDALGGRNMRFDDVVTRIEAKFEPATAKPGDTVTWILTVELIPGWHTYPTKQPDPNAASQITRIKFPENGDLRASGPIVEPKDPIKKAYPELQIKQILELEGSVVWKQQIKVSESATSGTLTYKVPLTIFACKESCLPPERRTTTADLKIEGGVHTNGSSAPIKTSNGGASEAIKAPVADDDADPLGSADHKAALNDILGKIAKQSVEPNTGLSSFLLTAAFWGAITLFTPCVFPMIPITVSFFLKQAEKNHGNALTLAIVYCGTIVVVLGAAALTLLEFFTMLSINPWMNVFLGSLFVVLALSLFGMFDLTLPNFLTRFTSAREGRGGILGTVFMALTFTVVSFTCVAPFLGGFGGMASSGQFRTWELILGAGAFAGTFAAPFFLLALFPSMLKRLPKSGGWLNTVKVVMGFLELAAALKFFRTAELIHSAQPTIFTFDLVLGMWIALSLLCGLYLINVFRLGHDEPLESVSVPRLLVGFLFLSMAFYLTPALFAVGPHGEKQRPRGSIFAWVDSFLLPDSSEAVRPGEQNWVGDLKYALDRARKESARSKQQKLVFVDFTGESCTNCKLNERNVFNVPEIEGLFKSYELVRMYTDKVPDDLYPTSIRSQFKGSTAQQRGDAELNRLFQNQAFGTIQLPLYVILKPTVDGPVEVVGVYSEGKINNVGAFAEFLKKPLDGKQ